VATVGLGGRFAVHKLTCQLLTQAYIMISPICKYKKIKNISYPQSTSLSSEALNKNNILSLSSTSAPRRLAHTK
jgi:hypothetical protein